MAIFNSGAAIGAIIAPPTIVWLQHNYGWQRTFLVTGGLGFIWLILWIIFYQTPDRHPWLRDDERALILAGQHLEEDQRVQPSEVTVTTAEQPQERDLLPATHFGASSGEKIAAEIRWRDLLRYRQVWAIAAARFFVDKREVKRSLQMINRFGLAMTNERCQMIYGKSPLFLLPNS
jgi:ACS family hexuronate transporter-like MFS transporter